MVNKLRPLRGKLRAPKPPMGAAMHLQKAMRAYVDALRASVHRHVLDEWTTNAVAHGPSWRADSLWSNRRLAAVKDDARAALPALEVGIDEAGARVDAKNVSEMRRLIPVSIRKEVGGHAAIDRFRQANLSRIKSLTDASIEDLRGILNEAEKKAMRVEDLADEIEERLGVTSSKAELLARDQTMKLNAALTKERQTQSGIERYEWSTSGDERVRPMHVELDGKEFSWDDPPETNEDGDTNAPGEDYQCRCVAIPVLPEIEDMLDADGDEENADESA